MAMQEVASDAFLKKHGLKGAGETSMPALGGGLSCSARCSHPLQVATSLRRSRARRSKRSLQSEFAPKIHLVAARLSDDRGRVQFPG